MLGQRLLMLCVEQRFQANAVCLRMRNCAIFNDTITLFNEEQSITLARQFIFVYFSSFPICNIVLIKPKQNSYLIGLRLKYMFIMLTVIFLMELTHKLIALLLFQISSPSSIMICLPTVCVSNNIKKIV